jgi:hypothetical protein
MDRPSCCLVSGTHVPRAARSEGLLPNETSDRVYPIVESVRAGFGDFAPMLDHRMFVPAKHRFCFGVLRQTDPEND